MEQSASECVQSVSATNPTKNMLLARSLDMMQELMHQIAALPNREDAAALPSNGRSA